MKKPEEIISDLDVSVYHNPELEYPDEPPYSPHIRYPEYFFNNTSEKENGVYDAVRNALFLLGLDKDNFDTPQWNPFREIIKPKDTVVIKPNFVLSNHEGGGDLFSIITHPSVIRAVVDYVYIALAGEGRIIIADAPQMDCNFNELLEKTKIESSKELYEKELGFNIELYDLRDFWLDKKASPKAAYSKNRHKLPGDPQGGVLVNLGRKSLFYEVNNYKRFYGADYNREETIKHHHGDVQEYLVCKTILSADVVIFVPKLKVHKKVGVTLNIKGLVGTCGNKNYLVHYTLGTPSEGGDQFPDGILSAKEATIVKLQRKAYDMFLSRKNQIGDFLYEMTVKIGGPLLKLLGFKSLDRDKSILDAGNWYGNDSAWRMAVDLLKIFIYVDKNGRLQDAPVRRMFSIVDGVIGGEADGPLTPDSKRCGLIVAGFNPCAVDLVCTRLMGFDYKKIKMLKYVLDYPELFKVSLPEIRVSSNKDFGDLFEEENKNKYFDFEPPIGWKGYVLR
jgi:uncharacterized protein (DUF362 family)